MASLPFQILLVEDDPGDVELTRIGLSRLDIPLELRVFNCGQAALDCLQQHKQNKEAQHPHLILLDLNLPGMSGKELLRFLKLEPELCSIPVVILSTSDSRQDILETYTLGANCYVKKQTDLRQFMKTVEQIEQFWLTTVELPPQ